MYRVSVRRDLITQHHLAVPDPGPEGELHSHAFTVEVELSGPELDEYGCLVDIDDVKVALDATLSRYHDETVNELVEFSGQNPSVERFVREVYERFVEAASFDAPQHVSVRVWEDDVASATYKTPLWRACRPRRLRPARQPFQRLSLRLRTHRRAPRCRR